MRAGVPVMASGVMLIAADKAIAGGGNLADAIDAAIRAQVEELHAGGETIRLSMASVSKDDILHYFVVEAK